MEIRILIMEKRRIILSVFTAAIIITGMSSCINLSKEHEEARAVDLSGIDFNNLQDGTYEGEYAGGMYEWRYNLVDVTVNLGKVVEIEVIEAKEEADFKSLYQRVIDEQSLEVDTISGATLTSKAFLKSVHSALLQAQK